MPYFTAAKAAHVRYGPGGQDCGYHYDPKKCKSDEPGSPTAMMLEIGKYCSKVEIATLLIESTKQAASELYHSDLKDKMRRSGCTFSGAFVFGNKITTINLGDSAVFRANPADERFLRLTKEQNFKHLTGHDHPDFNLSQTPGESCFRIQTSQRSFKLNVAGAIGDMSANKYGCKHKDVRFEGGFGHAEVTFRDFWHGDYLFACSDGFTDYLEDNRYKKENYCLYDPETGKIRSDLLAPEKERELNELFQRNMSAFKTSDDIIACLIPCQNGVMVYVCDGHGKYGHVVSQAFVEKFQAVFYKNLIKQYLTIHKDQSFKLTQDEYLSWSITSDTPTPHRLIEFLKSCDADLVPKEARFTVYIYAKAYKLSAKNLLDLDKLLTTLKYAPTGLNPALSPQDEQLLRWNKRAHFPAEPFIALAYNFLDSKHSLIRILNATSASNHSLIINYFTYNTLDYGRVKTTLNLPEIWRLFNKPGTIKGLFDICQTLRDEIGVELTKLFPAHKEGDILIYYYKQFLIKNQLSAALLLAKINQETTPETRLTKTTLKGLFDICQRLRDEFGVELTKLFPAHKEGDILTYFYKQFLIKNQLSAALLLAKINQETTPETRLTLLAKLYTDHIGTSTISLKINQLILYFFKDSHDFPLAPFDAKKAAQNLDVLINMAKLTVFHTSHARIIFNIEDSPLNNAIISLVIQLMRTPDSDRQPKLINVLKFITDERNRTSIADWYLTLRDYRPAFQHKTKIAIKTLEMECFGSHPIILLTQKSIDWFYGRENIMAILCSTRERPPMQAQPLQWVAIYNIIAEHVEYAMHPASPYKLDDEDLKSFISFFVAICEKLLKTPHIFGADKLGMELYKHLTDEPPCQKRILAIVSLFKYARGIEDEDTTVIDNHLETLTDSKPDTTLGFWENKALKLKKLIEESRVKSNFTPGRYSIQRTR